MRKLIKKLEDILKTLRRRSKQAVTVQRRKGLSATCPLSRLQNSFLLVLNNLFLEYKHRRDFLRFSLSGLVKKIKKFSHKGRSKISYFVDLYLLNGDSNVLWDSISIRNISELVSFCSRFNYVLAFNFTREICQ